MKVEDLYEQVIALHQKIDDLTQFVRDQASGTPSFNPRLEADNIVRKIQLRGTVKSSQKSKG